jgi:aminopeptidase N
MIKDFASDERFIYDNQVVTSDFTTFVQNYSGKDLEGFFDLYLKSVRVPKVKINKKGKNRYAVSLPNIDFEMPVEIITSKGPERIVLSKKPIIIQSDILIQVDPIGWYLLDHK